MQMKQKTFKLKDGIENIFAVPKKNTICTNSLDNSLTLMLLDDKKIKYSTLAKDFLRYVSIGKFQFLPVFSDNVICYVKQRMVVMFDILKLTHTTHLVCENLEESIVDADIIGKTSLILTTEKFSDDPADMGEPDYLLKKYLIDLQNMPLVKEIKLNEDQMAYVNEKNIFVCSDKDLTVYSPDFVPVEHPLSDFYTKKQEKENSEIDIYELVVHPALPFAIVKEDGKTSLVEWRDEFNELQIFSKNMAFFEFSPDKKWIIYWQVDKGANKLYAMKVNPESKTFLDLPVFLGEFTNIPDNNSATWMPDPMSYVMVDKEKQELLLWSF